MDISDDGRYVSFYSMSTNLVSPATSGQHIFRKNVQSGEALLVSCDSAGVQGNSASSLSSISADGRYVAFSSTATNLITPATSPFQIFRKDLITGEVRLVSCDASGIEGNGASSEPAISADGRYVAFSSHSTNLVSPATTNSQIFRKDLQTGEVSLCSSNAAGGSANNICYEPDISSDGRYVAFQSLATNLVSPPTSSFQIFRKDLATGELRLASCNAAGVQGNVGSAYCSMSSSGRYVVFATSASNLVSPPTGNHHVFRKDMQSGEVRLCSCDGAGTEANGVDRKSVV